jgi:hypothetical protein
VILSGGCSVDGVIGGRLWLETEEKKISDMMLGWDNNKNKNKNREGLGRSPKTLGDSLGFRVGTRL